MTNKIKSQILMGAIVVAVLIQGVSLASADTDYFGYTFKDSNTVGGPTYDWIEISETGTMILPCSDDHYVNGIPIGFLFNYYGADCSQVGITNNGIIRPYEGTKEWNSRPIGSSNIHNFIAPFWDDLVTWGSDSAIYYQVMGEAPNRKFVVEWFDNQHRSDPPSGTSPSGITFEAILYEGTNDIKFQYKNVDFGSDFYNNGASATVGIEGPDGRGLQCLYNVPMIFPSTAILFKEPKVDMVIRSHCPVDLIVTDPDGVKITKEIQENPGVFNYVEGDIDGDGDLDDMVIIPEKKSGDYSIEVIPESGADPTETYTLEVSAGDSNLVLVKDAPVGDIPNGPYIIESTEDGVTTVTTDVEKPVIQSVVLFPANTTAGSKINISANVTDNIGVVNVTAGKVPLTKDNDGFWRGKVTAPSSVGSYSLLINASDTAGHMQLKLQCLIALFCLQAALILLFRPDPAV